MRRRKTPLHLWYSFVRVHGAWEHASCPYDNLISTSIATPTDINYVLFTYHFTTFMYVYDLPRFRKLVHFK